MVNYKYRRDNAMVHVTTSPESLEAKIDDETGKDTLSFDIKRRYEKKTWTYFYSSGVDGDPGAECTGMKHVVHYEVDVKVGAEGQKFKVEFVPSDTYSDWVYDMEKGIPAVEYKNLCNELANQNIVVAKALQEYVPDDAGLQSENNLLSSAFNRALDLRMKKGGR